MSESNNNGLGLDIDWRRFGREHKRMIFATIGGGLAVTGALVAWHNRDSISELFTDDKGAEVSGWLQAQGMNSLDFKLPHSSEYIQIICPESEDIFSDPLNLVVEKHLGNIESVAAVVPVTETVTHLNADNEPISVKVSDLDPLRFNLDTPDGQSQLNQFVAATEACEPT